MTDPGSASGRLPGAVLRLLETDPGIDRVELVGSRARGAAMPRSDWDFLITTGVFAEVRRRLPAVAARLHPVVAQWDRLSSTWCYMLILAGPVKVDLIFAEPHAPLPAWCLTARTLPGIDDHFWDWMLWLAAKQEAGKPDLVATELAKLHEHLLAPLGVTARPATPAEAVASYRAARDRWERRLHCRLGRAAEQAVSPALCGE
ncbi:MAG: nucleotidyltransferase domain-containing protein [Streptosporangiaceae bacterium]